MTQAQRLKQYRKIEVLDKSLDKIKNLKPQTEREELLLSSMEDIITSYLMTLKEILQWNNI